MTERLFIATRRGLSLGDSLKALGTAAVGLFYAPGWCRFGVVDAQGGVTFAGGHSLDGVYEARVFHEDAELRWWNDPASGNHRSALLSGISMTPEGWKQSEPIPVHATQPQTYLLWGKSAGTPSPDWTRLTAARIGELMVPVSLGAKRYALRAIEYLGEYEDGNIAVREERLVALQPAGEAES